MDIIFNRYFICIPFLMCFQNTVANSSQEILGQSVFERECQVCHSPGNRFYESLKAAYKGTEYKTVAERGNFKPEITKHIVRSWGQRMPAFRPTEVTDTELNALAAYLSRNLGN